MRFLGGEQIIVGAGGAAFCICQGSRENGRGTRQPVCDGHDFDNTGTALLAR